MLVVTTCQRGYIVFIFAECAIIVIFGFRFSTFNPVNRSITCPPSCARNVNFMLISMIFPRGLSWTLSWRSAERPHSIQFISVWCVVQSVFEWMGLDINKLLNLLRIFAKLSFNTQTALTWISQVYFWKSSFVVMYLTFFWKKVIVCTSPY